MKCALENGTYDKIKILHELCSLVWFIKKHALVESKEKGDKKMEQLLNDLCNDMDKYIKQLKDELC